MERLSFFGIFPSGVFPSEKRRRERIVKTMILEKYNEWLTHATEDPDLIEELKSIEGKE